MWGLFDTYIVSVWGWDWGMKAEYLTGWPTSGPMFS